MVLDFFFELLQLSLGTRDNVSHVPNAHEWKQIYELAEEQAIVGVLFEGLQRCILHSKCSVVNLQLNLKLHWIGKVQIIQQKNKMMNKAVVNLCQEMLNAGIRIFIFKGQTLAVLYDDSSLRQSGDIDFYCHPDDWEKGLRCYTQNQELCLIPPLHHLNLFY